MGGMLLVFSLAMFLRYKYKSLPGLFFAGVMFVSVILFVPSVNEKFFGSKAGTVSANDIVQGDALSDMAFTAPGDYSKNPVNLVWDAMEADASNGHILTLSFQIPEEAEERNYEVNLSYKPGAICDNDMNDVDFAITNGVITVKNLIPGDVTGDESVDVKDIIILRRFIASGYDITYVEDAVDINRDGSNDVKDIITLRRYIAGGYGIVLK
jgi:hypothetical protein